jgi:hypothetical protein
MDKDPKIKLATFIIILAAVTLVLRILEYRVAAWNIDEFIFAAGGQKILAGGTLYRDFGDNKPPLIYYTYALLYHIAGKDTLRFFLVYKLATILAVFFTGLGFYCGGKNIGGKKLGMLAALLFSAYSICAPGAEVLGGRTELYATLLAMASICFFTRNNFSFGTLNMLMSGFLLSVSTLYNTRFGIIGVVYLAFIAYKDRINLKSILAMAALGVSFVPLLAAVPGYFYHIGVLPYYTFWQSTVFKHYLNALPWYIRFLTSTLVLVFFACIAPLTIFALYNAIKTIRENYGSAVLAAKRGPGGVRGIPSRTAAVARILAARDPKNDAFVFLVLLIFFQYAAFFAGGVPGVRYFYMMYIPICFLAARGIIDAFGYIREWSAEIKIASLLKIIMITFLVLTPVFFFLLNYNSRKQAVSESYLEEKDAADYIRAHTAEDQRIYVWSSMHPLYLYSNRAVATSMVYPFEFLTRYYYYIGDFRKDINAWDIFLKQLNEERPVLVLDNTGNFTTGVAVLYSKKNEFVETKLEELRKFVKDNYEYKTTLSGYKIYRLK